MNTKSLKNTAKDTLNAAVNARQLMLLYVGVSLLLTVLCSALDVLLQQQIDTTGGLSGIGTRSILSTVQTLLHFVPSLLLPFWNMGYIYTTIRIARRENTQLSDLTTGFRHFGAVIWLHFLQGLIYLLIGVVASYLLSAFLLFTGLAAPLMDTLRSFNANLSPEHFPQSLQDAALPLFLGFLGLYLLLFLPIHYRLRLSSYFLMDDPEKGVIYAIISSFQHMRGNCLFMLRLDLSFLWFYILEILIGFLCYGDVLANALGIPLPLSPTGAFFAFLGAYALCQLGLYLWKKNYLSVTYACTYEALTQQPENP